MLSMIVYSETLLVYTDNKIKMIYLAEHELTLLGFYPFCIWYDVNLEYPSEKPHRGAFDGMDADPLSHSGCM